MPNKIVSRRPTRALPHLARRPPTVELITRSQGRLTTVAIRSVRSRRTLFECSARDVRGAELAMLTAERYCVERGLVLIMPSNDTSRATAAA